jgi:hypothetical protein
VVAVRPAQHGAHTPTITTTNPQNLYAQATSGTPVFNEPMNSQNTNDWTALPGSSCTFTTTGLRMTTPSGVKNAACMAQSTDFTNFAFQVQMTIVQGEQGGLLFARILSVTISISSPLILLKGFTFSLVHPTRIIVASVAEPTPNY